MDPGDRLLLVDIACCDGAVTIRSVWATTPDRRAGRRRTDVELIADEPALLKRLAELVARLVPPAAAVLEVPPTRISHPPPAATGGPHDPIGWAYRR